MGRSYLKMHVLAVMLLRRKKERQFEERFSEIYLAAFITK